MFKLDTDQDPTIFWKLDPDLYPTSFQKADPDPKTAYD